MFGQMRICSLRGTASTPPVSSRCWPRSTARVAAHARAHHDGGADRVEVVAGQPAVGERLLAAGQRELAEAVGAVDDLLGHPVLGAEVVALRHPQPGVRVQRRRLERDLARRQPVVVALDVGAVRRHDPQPSDDDLVLVHVAFPQFLGPRPDRTEPRPARPESSTHRRGAGPAGLGWSQCSRSRSRVRARSDPAWVGPGSTTRAGSWSRRPARSPSATSPRLLLDADAESLPRHPQRPAHHVRLQPDGPRRRRAPRHRAELLRRAQPRRVHRADRHRRARLRRRRAPRRRPRRRHARRRAGPAGHDGRRARPRRRPGRRRLPAGRRRRLGGQLQRARPGRHRRLAGGRRRRHRPRQGARAPRR